MTALEDLVAYLDSVSPWYPGGVPLGSAAGEAGEPRPRVLFLAVGELSRGASVWEGEEGDLLRKAVTNGMRIPIEEVRLLRGPSGSSAGDWRHELSTTAPRVAVALGAESARELTGGEAPRGKWIEMEGIKLISTHSLAEVIEDASLKRAFWEDLRKVMEELARA